MNERAQAEQTQQEANALLNNAKAQLTNAVANMRDAIEASSRDVNAAQDLATQFNREVGRTWMLETRCGVECGGVGMIDLLSRLTAMMEMRVRPCAITRGVRVKLSNTLQYPDCERGAVIMMSEREAQLLEKDLLISRIAPE